MSDGLKGFAALLVALFLVCLFSGCAKKRISISEEALPKVSETTETGIARLSQEEWNRLGIKTVSEEREFIKEAQRFENVDVHFDFDSYILTDEAKRILDEKIIFLRKYPGVRVILEGHCDERGTAEYNLALGQRRAQSVWQYLVNSGINPDSLETISYGEERPLDPGHSEEAWAKNRRVHFHLEY